MKKHHIQVEDNCNRRDFLRFSAAAGLGTALGSMAMSGCASMPRIGRAPTFDLKPIEHVRVGIVGVGGRGSGHVRNLLKVDGVEIRAVGDIDEERVRQVQKMVREAGQPEPAGYFRGPTDFKRLCDEQELDIVYTATPWQWHAPICVYAMNAGKHAATEVPACVTVDECWQLVDTSEKTGKHCVILENCCYGRNELMVLNMVRKGLFGDLLHGECGYLHDLRSVKFAASGEADWRTEHSARRNGNLYPTHGLGPVAQYMNINRGDRFDYLVSMSGPSKGLQLYTAKRFGPDDPRAQKKYICGDVNLTLIKTCNGLTIYLVHDCNNPRPYSRINMIQGTKGVFRDYPARIYIEGRTKDHDFESANAYHGEFAHPLWKAVEEKAKGSGHGGMDYVMNYRLIRCLQTGQYPDMDVYDAAAWSVISELTERSVANRSRPVDVPDFTRGAWKTNKPLGIVGA